jgi:glycosyltransferase involved in cell wall biosynthesis
MHDRRSLNDLHQKLVNEFGESCRVTAWSLALPIVEAMNETLIPREPVTNPNPFSWKQSHEGMDMKILCVGTNENGGAGLAMRRLADSLRSAGARVDILALERGHERDPYFGEAMPGLQVSKRVHSHIRRSVRQSRTAVTNTIFTLDWPAWDIASHPAVVHADIINLHWVTGFLNPTLIRRLVDTGKPIVWTLHDQRAFTGGCHYTAGCEAFASECDGCPQLAKPFRHIASRLLREAREQLHEAKLTFVTPSRWLGEELRRSALFNASLHGHHVIPYGIDLDRFSPQRRKRELRDRFSLPADGLGIVFGSVSLKESRKGFASARLALKSLAARLQAAGHAGAQPFLITFGRGKPKFAGISSYHLGPQNEEGVISVLNAGDVFFTMTREDNLPNTVMEAIACGVPVIGTRVGGVPDMIVHGQQGWLVERDDWNAASEVLVDLVNDTHQLQRTAAAARQRAQDCFAAIFQAQRYLELFSNLFKAKASTGTREPFCGPPLPMVELTPAMREMIAARNWFHGVTQFLRRCVAG